MMKINGVYHDLYVTSLVASGQVFFTLDGVAVRPKSSKEFEELLRRVEAIEGIGKNFDAKV